MADLVGVAVAGDDHTDVAARSAGGAGPFGRLARPKYFDTDGIAIHGYSFVPPSPASHGCVRVTNAAIDYIWSSDLAPIGANVWVYGTTPRT